HHIVSDGWSMGVLVREVAALYEAHAHGGTVSLPDLPVQYADYAVWQREWLTGAVLDEQLAYWRQQLAGAPPVLELPTDRPRPKLQTFRGAALALELPRDLTDELKSLSRREGVTLFMTLLAAWQTLLARYSGQTDILIGSPIANRRRSEIENLIGFFANTLVLRTDLSGDPTFSELLARVREVCLGAYAHQDVPFEMLVEELQPERSLAHTPLFQVLLVLQNAPGAELSLPGLKLTPLLPQSGTSKFDLMMFLEESDAGLGGVFEYNTDLFDEATIKRLLQHFEQLLRATVAAPRTRISALPLMAEAEARRLLVEWNDTATEFPRDLCIHELVEQQAAATPEAVAAIFGDERLTYAELNARANQLAHTLRAHGVGPEEVVGLLVTRSLAMLVGVLGVLKAGGAYLPLDAEHPRERLAFMLADARARVLLTEAHLRERSPDTAAQVFTLDADWGAIARAPQVNPTLLTTAENAAYVIYTSGSTGKPKAVVMQHRAAVNLITFQRASSGAIAAAPRTLQFAPLSFDVSFQEIFSTWAAGGTLVLLTDDERRDARELLRVIERQQVERLFLPFVALQHLAEATVEAGRAPASLRAIITAGEQLKITRQVEQFFTRLSDCVLDNHYGPTETHLVTIWRLAGAAHTWPALPSIGRPIANARVYVLDDAWRPVPTGVAGELYVGGAGLARGYLDRPGQTAARFIPDPFSPEPGARLYRTGDVARYLSDGRLEYLGRVDNQVKIRGFRIEIGEVEAVIKQHGAVKQAVVNAHEDAAGRKRLVAYVVAKQGAACTPTALRDFLKEQLPEYMIPAAFVLLTALPLTPSGKVDRRALPAPDEAHAALAGDHVAPRSPV
ncbi:MAG TPA: amino acid adenylation domain-containing protein, partial [Pyrinomonadaceae bacterium]|nr:amino acid adenylation domain-containing protein [Pyrinomonadaceae bacterium]